MFSIFYFISTIDRSKRRISQEIVMGYDPATTAILLVDPYNDFLSEGGKIWPR
jgi:hypothetical protein